MTIKLRTPTVWVVFNSGILGIGGTLGSGLGWDNNDYGQAMLSDFIAYAMEDQYGSELVSSPFPLRTMVNYGCSDSGSMGGGAFITRAAFKITTNYTGYESDVLRYARIRVAVKAYQPSLYSNPVLLGKLSPSFDFTSPGAYGRMSSGGSGFSSISEAGADFVTVERDVTGMVTLGQNFCLCLTGIMGGIPTKPTVLGETKGGGTYVYIGAVQLILDVTASELEVDCLPATNISTNSATINGVLVNTGAQKNFCRCRLEWGQGNYNNKGPWQYISEGGQFSMAIGGLEPDTTYQYRAVATDEISIVYSNCSFTTLDSNPDTEVVTIRIEMMRDTWVLSMIQAIPAGKELYCGVQWWRSEDDDHKCINWHNPPDGATVIRNTTYLWINIGGLSPGLYYWQAYGEDADTGTVYTGIIKSFVIPGDDELDPIYERGAGNSYLTPQRAIQHVAEVSDGRLYSNLDIVVYKSRKAREI